MTEPQDGGEVLGRPEVILRVRVDRPQAAVAVRLCELFPDGRSQLVTWGLFNLSHRDSHEAPSATPVGESFEVTVPLNMCGYQLSAGSCWQVAVSPTYWPHLWPSPEPVTLTVERCVLSLPVRVAPAGETTIEPYERPECAEPLPLVVEGESLSSREVRFDRKTGMAHLEAEEVGGFVRFADGWAFKDSALDRFSIREGDVGSAVVVCERSRTFRLADWQVHVETESEMRGDRDYFYLTNQVKGWEGDALVFEKRWEKRVGRDFQ